MSYSMDYSNNTLKELIAICKEKGIKGYSKKKKDELLLLLSPPTTTVKHLTYVDLFSGIGGFRYGIEAFQTTNPSYEFKCIKTVDIKKDAINTYNINFNEENIPCDICTVKDLPHFDLLCAGFPCQPFSSAGNKKGLDDEGRGNLIFEVVRICRESSPTYIILENVSNIETINSGEILKRIVSEFEKIGYMISCVSVNSSQVGLAQDRKRLFIVGKRTAIPDITIHSHKAATIKDIIDNTDGHTKLPVEFIKKLLTLPPDQIIGRSIKDKRGGDDNIHSWDISYHGIVTDRQKILLNTILLERRKKKWAEVYGIKWMDGMPLSFENIKTFLNYDGLLEDLTDLEAKRYLTLEHPKDLIDGKRVYKMDTPIGYNISKGKLSFPISKVLDPEGLSPTLTATDSSKLAVYTNNTIRQLNEKELKRLCGFPETMKLPDKVNMYDLFGNMVCPPVITEILKSLIQ
jgi:DNA (cytosine-5)-methyltransferase 1